MGTSLYHNFAGDLEDEAFKAKMELLAREIGDRGKPGMTTSQKMPPKPRAP
eukprot:COSAG01_NODE_34052_length_554_cov_1.248352_2_plen_50_part_01